MKCDIKKATATHRQDPAPLQVPKNDQFKQASGAEGLAKALWSLGWCIPAWQQEASQLEDNGKELERKKADDFQ